MLSYSLIQEDNFLNPVWVPEKQRSYLLRLTPKLSPVFWFTFAA